MSEIDENEFVDIPDYEGYYQINRLGVVKSLERRRENGYGILLEKIIKTPINCDGYYTFGLTKNNKRKHFQIHTLLWKIFIGNYDKRKFEIDHIDKNRQNNCLKTNLRLVTRRDNMNNRTDQSLFGCCVYKNGKNFQTKILINNFCVCFGTFKTQEEAHKKYLEIKSQIEEIEKVTRNYDFKRSKIGKEYFIEFFPIL